MFVFHKFYQLMGGMKGGLTKAEAMDEFMRTRRIPFGWRAGADGGLERILPFSSSLAPSTLVSTLDAEHGHGRGIFGFLNAQELRTMGSANRELLGATTAFPIGLSSLQFEVPTTGVTPTGESRMALWRQAHPNAKNIRINTAGQNNKDDLLIEFLSVRDSSGRLNRIDKLDLSNVFNLTDAVVPFLLGIKELNVTGNTALTLAGIDASRLEKLEAIDTLVDTATIQTMVHLRELAVGQIDQAGDPQTIVNPDFSMLPLEIASLHRVGVARLPLSIENLDLEHIRAPALNLGAYLSALPRLKLLSLKDAQATNFKFPASLEVLHILSGVGRLPEDAFENLQRLEELALNDATVPLRAFRFIPQLKDLGIFNGIEESDGRLFQSLPRLELFSTDRASLQSLGTLYFASIVRVEANVEDEDE